MTIQTFPHQPARLEHDSPLRRHLDLVQRTGILGHPGRGRLRLKDAEVTKLQTAALGEFRSDLVEKRLDHGLHERLSRAGTLGDAVDQVFLGCHGTVPR